jgi:DNA-binding transcriptional regulator YhcF (GntR family)
LFIKIACADDLIPMLHTAVAGDRPELREGTMATAKKATAKTAPARKKAAAKKAPAKKTMHTKRGLAQDRREVSAGQASEVYYEAKKMGVSTAAVKKAIKKVGNQRRNIEVELTKPAKKAAAKKSNRGLVQDRRQVAANQASEVYYEAKKMGVSKDAVKEAIKKVGNERADVEVELKKKKKKKTKKKK